MSKYAFERVNRMDGRLVASEREGVDGAVSVVGWTVSIGGTGAVGGVEGAVSCCGKGLTAGEAETVAVGALFATLVSC